MTLLPTRRGRSAAGGAAERTGRGADSRNGTARTAVIVAAGVVVTLAVLVAATLVGASGLPPGSVLADLIGQIPGVRIDSGLSAAQHAILWRIRLPRVVLGALVGGTLAIAGAAYQGVFRNPLADPYLLGVSSGAGVGATVMIVTGAASASGAALGSYGIPVAAFVGGIVAVAATYGLGRSVGGGRGEVVIILAGVAVAAFANAAQTFIQQRYQGSLHDVYSWLLGRLSTDGWSDVTLVLPYVAVTIAVILAFRRTLDVMSVGDVEAASLGIGPARVRLLLVCVATLGTAAVVSVSGLIGFVGIVVPHAVRLVFGPGHRLLLPLSVLVGAAFLVLADVLARWVVSPAELPIGVVTAAIGAPFFLVVLRRGRGMQ